jgi:hypothetical protein
MVILAEGSIGAAARIRFLQERTAMGAGISAGREHPRSRPSATVKPLWHGLVAPQSAEQSVAQMITSVTIVAGAVIGSGCKAKPANLGTKKGVPPALD